MSQGCVSFRNWQYNQVSPAIPHIAISCASSVRAERTRPCERRSRLSIFVHDLGIEAHHRRHKALLSTHTQTMSEGSIPLISVLYITVSEGYLAHHDFPMMLNLTLLPQGILGFLTDEPGSSTVIDELCPSWTPPIPSRTGQFSDRFHVLGYCIITCSRKTMPQALSPRNAI
jgi:hypothetical protein